MSLLIKINYQTLGMCKSTAPAAEARRHNRHSCCRPVLLQGRHHPDVAGSAVCVTEVPHCHRNSKCFVLPEYIPIAETAWGEPACHPEQE